MSSFEDSDPPEDDMEILAAEYVLGLLTVAQLPHVTALRQGNLRFEQAVHRWELRLLPLAEALEPVSPSPFVWSAIAKAIEPPARPASAWDSLKLWRGFSLAAGAVCAVLVAAIVLHKPPPSPMQVATALLTSKADGSFVAMAEPAAGSTRLLVSPSQAAVPAGKCAELWLITPGSKPAALGLLANDRAVAFNIPAAQLPADLRLAELAITLEPPGGSPTGVATGPIIAAAKLQPL
jgi:anti-sigma-K factor RskA